MDTEKKQADDAFMQAFFDQGAMDGEYSDQQIGQIDQALKMAVKQKNRESALVWKYSASFLALFVFLYATLGTSLTLPVTSGNSHYSHRSIEYALEAIPVLIAFSGYFIAILYLFHCKTSARRAAVWEEAIYSLEKQTTGKLFHTINVRSAGTNDYSGNAISTVLALFIGFTWLVIYNYLTFTTSGVMGSVISLFISTMTYVILDIQLLKPSGQHAAPTDPGKEESAEEETIQDKKSEE